MVKVICKECGKEFFLTAESFIESTNEEKELLCKDCKNKKEEV